VSKFLRSQFERSAHARMFYPNTDVYRNKLDIRDEELLEDAEREITAQRADEVFPRTAHHRHFAGFRAIHRHLFKDLYTWAGKVRTYTTGRGPIPFATPDNIESWMNEQFSKLKAKKYLVGLDADDFAMEAAEIVNEINAGHPFPDGNGRTQRHWLRMLANNAGFELTLRETDRELWNEASRIGFEKGDHAPMAAFIRERLADGNPSPDLISDPEPSGHNGTPKPEY